MLFKVAGLETMKLGDWWTPSLYRWEPSGFRGLNRLG